MNHNHKHTSLIYSSILLTELINHVLTIICNHYRTSLNIGLNNLYHDH